jgi:thiamine kinase-like enzyme
MRLEACLPPELRGPATTITPIAAGLSGAGVYRVEAAGQTYVLKVAATREPAAEWRHRVNLQRLAAGAGVAPRVVHADEERRAVLSAFVADRSFMARYADPRTKDAAVAQLGRTIRRVHDLPIPPDATARPPRALLARMWPELGAVGAVPAFVREAVGRMLVEEPPADARALVLSHNDVNPTNLVYDGESILLLDWQTAGPMHPFFDLAAISVFLRMDEATCRALLAAYDGAPVEILPPRFAYTRRLAAVVCGACFLWLAREAPPPAAPQTLDVTRSLAEVYQRLRAGELDVASAEGQWAFGLALVKAGVTP